VPQLLVDLHLPLAASTSTTSVPALEDSLEPCSLMLNLVPDSLDSLERMRTPTCCRGFTSCKPTIVPFANFFEDSDLFVLELRYLGPQECDELLPSIYREGVFQFWTLCFHYCKMKTLSKLWTRELHVYVECAQFYRRNVVMPFM
jgi:hypothetical protein